MSDKGLYLSNQGQKNLGIYIHNVPKVEVKVYKIYESNLIHFLRNRNMYNNMGDYYLREWEQYGDVVFEKEYTTKNLPLVNDFRVLHVDFEQIKGERGIYAVHISSTENQWTNASKMISISDIGFIAKSNKEDISVFVNSLIKATPLKGVKVNLISQSNQILAQTETNEQGVAQFSEIKRKYPQADIRLVTAHYGNDFNYLYFNQSEVDKASFETGGLTENSSGYQAFLYGERDLYRPGETINLNVVVRNRQWQPVPNIPIKVKFKLPNGRDMTVLKGNLSSQGAYSPSLKLTNGAMTGTYYAEVYTSTDILLNSMPISVEEFMPDRIKVKLKLTKEDFQSDFKGEINNGDSLRVLISAQNLFGPPAANRAYQANFYVSQSVFSPKGYDKYDFKVQTPQQGDSDNFSNLSLMSRDSEGNTDAKGQAYERFAIPKEYEHLGLLQGNVFATVFDETGRSVSRKISFDISTQKAYLGMQYLEQYVSTNRPMPINLMALNAQGQPTATEARVVIYRYRWQTVLERNYSDNLQYVSNRKEEIVSEQNINLAAGGSSLTFTPKESGDYEVKVFLKNAKTFISQSFYAYGYGTDNTAFSVNPDGKIDITFDKEKYNIGESAKVLFTTPFNGRMLVTVERDKLIEYVYLNVQNKSATYTLPIKSEHLPNIYISATLIKPISDGAIPLTVAHGYQSMEVENADNQLNLSIEAPEKSESRQSHTIKVKTNRAESDIEVTVAVVDEGVLQLKNYDTPNPNRFFFQKRALQVDSYDLYPQLFPEITLNRSLVGGDAGDMGMRANPMVNGRVKLVRFWSGVLKTNALGEAYYTINIPQFSGNLRIMAVAHKGSRFGSAQKNMIVADPIVISTGLPRFLSPDDYLTIPVTVSNTTNNLTSASVQMELSNQLEAISETSKTIEVKANNETQLKFALKSKAVIDSAKVKIKVSALGREFVEELSINIRPPVGLVKFAGGGTLQGGMNQSIAFNQELIPATAQARLVLSNSPLIQYANNLEYLVQYPYGCVEQVTSSVFPQLYVQELMRVISPNKQNINLLDAQIRTNIQEGILRLESMQNYSGGLSYWQGGYETSWFGTAYAAHFLLEAKKAGYMINQAIFDQMLSYLRNNSDRRNTYDYTYFDQNGRRSMKKIIPKEAVYALYVLASANQADMSGMNYFKENASLLALDSKYLLAICYLMSGDRNTYNELLPKSFSGEISENAFGGSFHSYIRDQALVLNALVESDESSVQIPPLATALAEKVRDAKHLNTQECAFSLMALGKLAKKVQKNALTAQITNNGALVASFSGTDVVLSNAVLGKTFTIQAQGQGNLYYFWQASGMSANVKIKEGDNKIKVRRTFYDQFGNIIRNNTFRQNDLVVVKISVVAEPYYFNIDNVAITDMLPAGLEIENPRLTPTRTVTWVRASDDPAHLDLRDDRINIFTAVTGKTKNFYYLARAVTVGTFQLGPVSADAMYNGDYYSYANSGVVRIGERSSENN
jgi:uncharacterized protein YfaS (alpha-2-macroglobulin family)